VRVAYVRGSVLLRHVYGRPHRLSPGRGFSSLLKMHYWPGKGDGSAQPGAKYAIYDCLVAACYHSMAVL